VLNRDRIAKSESVRSHVAKASEKTARCESAEALEVFDHVHLVVVTELVGEIEPRDVVTDHLGVEHGLEPGDAGAELRAETNVLGRSVARIAGRRVMRRLRHPRRGRCLYSRRGVGRSA
jgi:hypothetical protein